MFMHILVAACAVSAIAGVNPKYSRSEHTRIFNGENARHGEFPFMVSMRRERNDHTILCGGAIISKYFVLTAGHCVDGEVAENVFIATGVTNLKEKGTFYATKKLIIHEKYGKDYRYDIGLIQVKNAFVFNDLVKPISLPKQSEYVPAGEYVTAMGWGYTALDPAKVPDQLQKVILKTVDTRTCGLDVNNGDGDLMLCAGGINGTGMCYGDSGSPLAEGSKLVGVVSRGTPCAQGYPDMFARVSYHISWINNHIAENEHANIRE